MENIILGYKDSDREIYYTIELKRLTRRPFTLTKEQAKKKLQIQRRKLVSTKYRQDTNTSYITTNPTVYNPTDSITTDSITSDSITTDPITTNPITTDSTTYNANPTIYNTTRAPSADLLL